MLGAWCRKANIEINLALVICPFRHYLSSQRETLAPWP
jgi:hypothetical protein